MEKAAETGAHGMTASSGSLIDQVRYENLCKWLDIKRTL
jgi:hypothetical protein